MNKSNSSKNVDVFKDPFATGKSKTEEKRLDLDDPLEPWNRSVNKFNETAFEYVGEPVARFYRDFTPELVRNSFRRFFHNLYEPSYTVNAALQGEFNKATVSGRRFIINTTFGGAGFFDPAGEHLKPIDPTFDETLGEWGVPPGFYVVWPFYGPSSARGTVAIAGDEFLDPINYVEGPETIYGLSLYRIISETSYQLEQYESLEKYTVDSYSAIKDFYEKKLYEQSKK